MKRRVPPEDVEAYDFGDDFNARSKYPRMTYGQALEIVEKKRGRWWNRHRTKLILFPAPEPSLSVDSVSALTIGDMEAAAGVRDMSRERRERIQAWNPAKRTAVA